MSKPNSFIKNKQELENAIKGLHIKWDDIIGKYYKRPNFWHIIEYGKESYETRYSRFLRWLLDSDENHGLGGLFAQELWCELTNEEDTSWIDSKVFAEVYFEEEHTDEDKKQRRFIDLLAMQFEEGVLKRCLVIELKVKSALHSNQLEAYARRIKKKPLNIDGQTYALNELDEKHRKYVVITPTGYEESEGEWDKRWGRKPESYSIITKILNEKILQAISNDTNENYNKDIRKLVCDFRDDLICKSSPDMADFEESVKKLKEHFDEVAKKSVVRDEVLQIIKRKFDDKRFIKEVERILPGQDHSPIPEGQMLVRKIFNDLVIEDKKISEENFGGKGHRNVKTPDIQKEFENGKLVRVELTSGKGQALWLYFENQTIIRLAVGKNGGKPYFPTGRGGVCLPGNKGKTSKDGRPIEADGSLRIDASKEVSCFLNNYDKELKILFDAIEKALEGDYNARRGKRGL